MQSPCAPAQVGPDILRYEFFYQSLVYGALILIGVHVQAEVSTASTLCAIYQIMF